MHFFDKLGALVEKRWRKKDFDCASFAGIALEALQEMPPSDQVDISQIVEWVMSAGDLPPQRPDDQPPLTLYRHPLFKIGLFYWLDDEHTPIHQHCVSGAFHHLSGASLHCLYRFELKDRVNSRLLIGELQLGSIECLMQGDSRPIENGSRTIHATFHLHRPTVTIVIQTYLDHETLPQYSYWKPSLAYDPAAPDELTKRQLELLEALHAAGDPDYPKHLTRRVSESTFEEAFWTLKQSFHLLDRDDLPPLLESARKQHGDRVDVLTPVFQEMRRTENVTARSRLISKPEHNFFIGLLLHLPDRESIFEFIRWHFGGDPVERIMRWIEEMAGIEVGGSAEPNILGVHFDEVSLLVFRCLLEGLSFAEIKKRLKREFDPASVDAQERELEELCAAFPRSSLFQPLFVAGTSASPIEISGRKWTPAG